MPFSRVVDRVLKLWVWSIVFYCSTSSFRLSTNVFLTTDELDYQEEEERNIFSDPESEWRRQSFSNSSSDGDQPESDRQQAYTVTYAD